METVVFSSPVGRVLVSRPGPSNRKRWQMVSRGGQLILLFGLMVMSAIGTWATAGRVNWGIVALCLVALFITWFADDERGY